MLITVHSWMALETSMQLGHCLAIYWRKWHDYLEAALIEVPILESVLEKW